MKKSTQYSPEVRERAVRLVHKHQAEHESQWAAIGSIANKISCTAETLRLWVQQVEKDRGERECLTTSERERLKALEREVRELRQANHMWGLFNKAVFRCFIFGFEQRYDRRPRQSSQCSAAAGTVAA